MAALTGFTTSERIIRHAHLLDGWVHWRDFAAGENGELLGKGCAA